MLQEVESWPCEAHIFGWTLVHSLGNPTAVLIPNAFNLSLVWVGFGTRCTGILFNHVFFVTAYLPDSWKPIDEFVQAVLDLTLLCKDASAKGATRFVVCSDTNLELPVVSPITGPQAVGVWPSSDIANGRLDSWMQFLSTFNLRVANTWLQSADRASWLTYVHPSRGRASGRQLDHIAISASVLSDCAVSSNRWAQSDHFAVYGKLTFPGKTTQRMRREPSLKGWRPDNAELFRRHIFEQVSKTCFVGDESADLISIHKCRLACESVALSTPSHSKCIATATSSEETLQTG